ncbi:MAG: type III-B CRISPR module RAMP protein Cmr6 [Deltaproteobacteria bacterium]|nr:type III-B CRISPR module RAMP protein Cmr6 [Deltaproteobacteria bacterium]
MVFYPFPEALQSLSKSKTTGNFGLWYNKFIPLSSAYKPSDESGKDTLPVEYYFTRYDQMKNNAADLLKCKHQDMDDYCASFLSENYEVIVICATLTTPLITGIGESHPHEVSIVFDHNTGIPYIPASGVKGIVRFAHTLSIFLDENGQVKETYKDQEYLDEAKEDIPDIFGGEKIIVDQEKEKRIILRGRVVFLDAYPAKIPDLHIDIMNPHYAPYYSEGKPPADHHNPTPIKFLTVAKGTRFIFRAVVEKKDNLPEKVRTAFIKALTEEGVGAKTAIGYGRFDVVEEKNKYLSGQPAHFKKQERTVLEKCCDAIKMIKTNDAGRLCSNIDNALKELAEEEDKKKYAVFVKEHMGGDFKKSKARDKLKGYLQ